MSDRSEQSISCPHRNVLAPSPRFIFCWCVSLEGEGVMHEHKCVNITSVCQVVPAVVYQCSDLIHSCKSVF